MINPYSFKRCPFCTSEHIKVMEALHDAVYCECQNCGARGPAAKPIGTAEQKIANARNLWNDRKSPTQAESMNHLARVRDYAERTRDDKSKTN